MRAIARRRVNSASGESSSRQQQADGGLSAGQKRIWFLEHINAGEAIFNMPAAYRMTGMLNEDALRRSLQFVIARHDSLRTAFPLESGSPTSRIHRNARLEWRTIDLQGEPHHEQQRVIALEMAKEESQPFDLANGPLVRATVLQLRPEEHVFLLTVHHIICDGWSVGILHAEVTRAYEDFCSGILPRIPPLQFTYGDYVKWQASWLETAHCQRQVSFWREQLVGSSHLQLPTDRKRPTKIASKGDTEWISLPAEVVDRLHDIARRSDATLFMILFAAFVTVLYRYTGERDIVTGVPVAGRNQAETQELIGFFVNYLAPRTRIRGNPTFMQLVRQIRTGTIEALEHQELPIDELIRHLHPHRGLADNPLFQVSFSLQNAPTHDLQPTGLLVTPIAVRAKAVRGDLEFDLWETSDGLSGEIRFRTELFAHQAVRQFAAHYREIVDVVGCTPELAIRDIPLSLGMPGKSGDDRTTSSRPWRLQQVLEHQDGIADRVAVISKAGRLTRSELRMQVEQVANSLISQGVGPDVVVAWFGENRFLGLVTFLATLRAGGACLALDTKEPRERLRSILNAARPRIIAAEDRHCEIIPAEWQSHIRRESDFRRHPSMGKRAPVSALPDSIACIHFTSGTTGIPKGVLTTYGSLEQHCSEIIARYQLTPTDRVLQFSNLDLDVAVEQILPTLMSGAVLVLPETESVMDERMLSSCEVTVANVPSLYFDYEMERLTNESELGSLRLLVVGGDRMALSSVEKWNHCAGEGRQLLNAYGPTEATITSSIFSVQNSFDVESYSNVPIGQPIGERQFLVLDESLNPVPRGAVGELFIVGNLARGYLNDARGTAEGFLPNPFYGSGQRMYRTGDQVRWRYDGTCEFLRRVDDQVKVHGRRVNPDEVAQTLKLHDGVEDAAVICSSDGGDAEMRLTAYVVPKPGCSFTPDVLRRFAARRLPRYMIPASFYLTSEIPRTRSGKVVQGNLQQQPIPWESKRPAASGNWVVQALREIWADALNCDEIETQDDFFQLGGHSLLAIAVMSRVRRIFQIDLPIRDLFQFSTLDTLSEHIARSLNKNTSFKEYPIKVLSKQGRLPLSFAQQRLWFVEQLVPNEAVYNSAVVFRVVGDFNIEWLQRSIQSVMERHDILRASAHSENGKPFFVITPEAE